MVICQANLKEQIVLSNAIRPSLRNGICSGRDESKAFVDKCWFVVLTLFVEMEEAMGNQKVIGMLLLVAGTVLIAWGYHTSNSVGGQLGQAFGSMDWKVLAAYVVGVVLSVAGVRKLK